MNALATEKKQDAEISYLRQNDSYEVWSNADRVEYMKNHPNAKLLTIRWVVTEKARLVVREYNTWRHRNSSLQRVTRCTESDSHDSS